MMATDDKMDMSLADIIKQDRQQQQQRGGGAGGGKGRGSRGSGRGGGGGGGGHFGGPTRGGYGGPVRYRGRGRAPQYGRPKWHHHDDFNGGAGAGGGWTGAPETGGKLLVSNLFFGVTDTDIVELFTSVGRLKKAAVRYDQYSGKSLGIADVHFDERDAALDAIKRFNGWTLDGRPMHIQLMDPAQFERQRRPPAQGGNKRGGGMHLNRFDTGHFGGVQKMSRSQRRRSHWPQQAGLPVKKLDAQIDAWNDMMDTS